ncbi:MAG: helix-turn-helix domain-containing protein [Nocardioides sp.]|uniref:helix-turn-helix domain-containing protein n=1 Tax=Nocardioides sp. TaxID=35761 RepID=UPI0039E32AEC
MNADQVELLASIDPADLGQRIKAARAAKGMTQTELAGELMSVGYVSRIEAGQRRVKPATLEAFADRLGVATTQLLLGITPSEYDDVRLELNYAELALESGQAAEAAQRSAVILGRALDSGPLRSLHAQARFVHATALEALGRLDEAIIELEDLIDDLPQGVLRTAVAIALSRTYRESGDLARSVDTAETVLRSLEGTPLASSDDAVQLAATLAAAHFERGDVGQAVRVCRRAVSRAESLASPAARAAAYWNASVIEAERGSVSDAVSLANQALALLREGRSDRNLARLQSELGILQLKLDPPAIDDAKVNLSRAADDFSWARITVADRIRNDLGLARAHLLAGDHGAAAELAQRLLDESADSLPREAADAATLLGRSLLALGRADEATAHYQRAVALLTRIGNDRTAAQNWFELAALLEDVLDLDAARDAYRRAAASTGLRQPTGFAVSTH